MVRAAYRSNVHLLEEREITEKKHKLLLMKTIYQHMWKSDEVLLFMIGMQTHRVHFSGSNSIQCVHITSVP